MVRRAGTAGKQIEALIDSATDVTALPVFTAR